MDDSWGLIVEAIGEHRMLHTIEAAERLTCRVIYERMEAVEREMTGPGSASNPVRPNEPRH